MLLFQRPSPYAVIFTSNRPLADERPEVRAVVSRIPTLHFAPPINQIRALMRHAARRGYVGEAGSMSPAECVEVVEYVIRLAAELQGSLDLRWIEHGYAHYLNNVAGVGTVDWCDMVKFHIMQTLTYFEHTPPKRGLGGRKEVAGRDRARRGRHRPGDRRNGGPARGRAPADLGRANRPVAPDLLPPAPSGPGGSVAE